MRVNEHIVGLGQMQTPRGSPPDASVEFQIGQSTEFAGLLTPNGGGEKVLTRAKSRHRLQMRKTPWQ